MSKTKLKKHKLTGTFKVKGFQTPFRKDNVSNGGGGIIVQLGFKNNIPLQCRKIN